MQIRVPFLGGSLQGQSTVQMANWLVTEAGELYEVMEANPCRLPTAYAFRGRAVPVQCDRLLPCEPSPITPPRP